MRSTTRRALLIGLASLGAAAPALAQQGTTRAGSEPPNYVVFFDFGSAVLTPNATSVIAEAAEAARRQEAEGRFSHIKAIGYADAAGPAAASLRLSRQRAAVVRDALVAQGIPADRVKVEGRGAKEPAVKGPNLREARNRRVRIVIFRPGD